MGINNEDYNYIYQHEVTGSKRYTKEPIKRDERGYRHWKLIYTRKDTQMKNNEVYKK